ncbi:FtsK/SpoIIIE domain-containing protein [Streptomyces sp. NBC_01237]|uniref:FtsK/SpoIIIE domain-containing protein n=1 Tax=Streptomyces sp. NBC_01237 TaxID=2903790 RepID=UPI002DD81FA4|nr:FtsK/SpoIIIE domain-containing protein [Streptomyces sp. NBC_01237]WRZ78724.1 FtsK/SpoIIIE domain-containing protein [Streptomyces sp. NBC_01237]
MRRKEAAAAAPVNTVGSGLALAGKAITGYVVAKSLPYAAPWIGAATLPPAAGLATNLLWGGDPMSAGLASAGLAIGGAALAGLTYKATPGTSKFARYRRIQATTSVAAGMGWLTAATAVGPVGHPMVDLWLFGGGLFAASWNLRQLVRNGAAGEVEEEGTGGGLGKLAAAIGWEKVRVKDAKGSGKGTVSATVAVEPGGTMEAVQATTGRVAAALQVPPSGVIVTPDPEDASQGTLSLRVADLLKDGVPFAMPRALGLLPTEDIPVGLYADGEVWALNPFSAAILQHLLVMGVTGAGKSEFLRSLVAHLATRRKMSIFLVDLAKGRQTVGHIADGLDWLIQDAKEAKRLLRSLPGAIKARGDVLASEGLDQWTPASSLNAVVVWIEEAADVADFEELEEIARKARSVGIWLGISLQRATWTNVSTDVRANLQATVCFGVNEAADAGFCLPDSVTGAGAVPAWGSDRPGYAFSTGMGQPQPRWTTEVRSGLTDRQVLADLVTAAAVVRDPLDETTATALGQAYAQRTHRGTNRLTPGVAQAVPGAVPAQAPAPAAIPAQAPAHDQETDDMAEDMTAQKAAAVAELQEAYDEVMGAIPADPEPTADYASLRLEDDVPDPDPDSDMEFEAPTPVSKEEARHILYIEIDGWVRSGRLEFEPADLIPATTAAGRKRPWMQGELKKLVETGLIHRDSHGSYSIVASPLQPA